jgi:hypothetical protein
MNKLFAVILAGLFMVSATTAVAGVSHFQSLNQAEETKCPEGEVLDEKTGKCVKEIEE